MYEKKDFDAVKMMRDIRKQLQEKYEKNPDNRKIDLEKIREKYLNTKNIRNLFGNRVPELRLVEIPELRFTNSPIRATSILPQTNRSFAANASQKPLQDDVFVLNELHNSKDSPNH